MLIKAKGYSLANVIRIPFACAPVHGALFVLFKILGGVVPSLEILAAAHFIDRAIGVVSSGGAASTLVLPVLFVILCQAYLVVGLKLDDLVKAFMMLRMKNRLGREILEKRARLKYRYIEDSESWDLISRVAKEPELQVQEGFGSTFSLLTILLRTAGIVVILVTRVWWAALVILAASVPLFIISARRGRAEYEMDREVSELRRQQTYLIDVLTSRETVGERTLFGYGTLLTNRYNRLFKVVLKKIIAVRRISFVRIKAGALVTNVFAFFVVAILLQPLAGGEITIGLFMALVNAVFGLSGQMSWMLSWITQTMAKASEYLKDLSVFAAMEEEEGSLDLPLSRAVVFESLELRDVTFRYPGMDTDILKNLSFTIEAGKHYALVGINGAGKTTITKLITGLYDNYEGEILINGRNLRDYSQAELKAFCAVVFQDFARYNIPLEDNIALGRMGAPLSREELEKVMEDLEISSWAADLPKGADTPLGKAQSNGADISGGQWQRVAMARGLVSPSPLRILDEPTAALDPVSESRLYRQFDELRREGTTLFISHRLGSTKLADEILVLSEGGLKEKGTHGELMDTGGLYARMFDSQKEWYL